MRALDLRLNMPVVLVVVTFDEGVARWARRSPPRGSVAFLPVVLGPAELRSSRGEDSPALVTLEALTQLAVLEHPRTEGERQPKTSSIREARAARSSHATARTAHEAAALLRVIGCLVVLGVWPMGSRPVMTRRHGTCAGGGTAPPFLGGRAGTALSLCPHRSGILRSRWNALASRITSNSSRFLNVFFR